MSTTPHGWYPDPDDDRSMRWWDGQAWTEHVQPLPSESPSAEPGPVGGPPSTAPASADPPPPQVTPAPPIEPPPPVPGAAPPGMAPTAHPPQPGRSGSAGPVIAIVAAVAVLTLGGAIAVFASGFAGSESADRVARGSTAEAPDATPPPAPEEGPSDDVQPPGPDDGPGEGPPPALDGAGAELAAVEGQPVISGTPLMHSDGDTDDPAVGEPVPVVDGADPTGAPVSIGSSGEPQLVLMVASWCPACHLQIPEFVTWREQGGDEDVEVVVVVTLLEPDRPGWPADEWALDEGIPADLLMDDRYGSVANAFGLYAVPYWVVIDAEGQLVQRQAGVIEPEQISELADAARTGPD
jgi:thiol-disulfide isomerase/thioredoxin